ncbi:MAG TPA: hypothetical protein VGN72_24170 [Tepidisphaeraceae bacterium]|nr:hypothetical protein [Tepidisphaeraceae bacterium]
MLRSTVERQAEEIRQLKRQLNEVPAATTRSSSDAAATTQPAALTSAPQPDANAQADRPRKVVYVLDGTAIGSVARRELGRSELMRALQRLHPQDQYAFVIVGLGREDIELSPATRENIDRTIANLPTNIPSTIEDGNPFDVLTRAVTAGAETVWYVDSGKMIRAKHASRIGKMAGDRGVRINTTTAYTDGSEDTAAYVWTLANASGGKCVDRQGRPVPRPAKALDPEVAAPITAEAPRQAPVEGQRASDPGLPTPSSSTNPSSIFDFND